MRTKWGVAVGVMALGVLALAVWIVWRPTPPVPGVLEVNGRVEGDQAAVGSPHALKAGMRAGVMLEVECGEPFRALRLLRAEPALAQVSLFGSRLHVLVEDATVAEPLIRTRLHAAGLVVERVQPIPFSLEDLFVIFIDMEEERWRETRA